MQVISLKNADYNVKQKISEIFVDGFYQWLKYFSKDKQKLAEAFAHMFNTQVFYAVEINGEIAGIAALNDGKAQTIQLNKTDLKKHLGFIRGIIAYKILKREFMDKQYPFELKQDTGYVEFVATSSEHRGKGAASAIITHFFSMDEYSEYVLEVADTNTNAVRLYEKLGFREFKRIEMKNKKQSGVNFLVYMRKVKER